MSQNCQYLLIVNPSLKIPAMVFLTTAQDRATLSVNTIRVCRVTVEGCSHDAIAIYLLQIMGCI